MWCGVLGARSATRGAPARTAATIATLIMTIAAAGMTRGSDERAFPRKAMGDQVAGFITRALASISREKLDSDSPSARRPPGVSR